MSTRRTIMHPYNDEPGSAVSLIGPEILLPAQFEVIFARRERFTPQQRLMVAVLESAVYDLQRYRHAKRMREKRFFREACEWFTTDDDKGPFSFLLICEALGFDPDYVRAGVLGPTGKKKKVI